MKSKIKSSDTSSPSKNISNKSSVVITSPERIVSIPKSSKPSYNSPPRRINSNNNDRSKSILPTTSPDNRSITNPNTPNRDSTVSDSHVGRLNRKQSRESIFSPSNSTPLTQGRKSKKKRDDINNSSVSNHKLLNLQQQNHIPKLFPEVSEDHKAEMKKKLHAESSKRSREKKKLKKESMKHNSESFLSHFSEYTSTEEVKNYINSLDSVIENLKEQILKLKMENNNLNKILDNNNLTFDKPDSTPWKSQKVNKLIIPIESTPIITNKLVNQFDSRFDPECPKDILKTVYAVLTILTENSKNPGTSRVIKEKLETNLREFVEQLMYTVLSGFLGEEIKNDILNNLKKTVYNEKNGSAALDSSQSSSLNYTGWDILRAIGVRYRYDRGSAITSASSIKRYNKDLAFGAQVILDLGDRIESSLCSFDIEPMIKHIITASGKYNDCYGFTHDDLTERQNLVKEKQTIVFTFTLDGALLTQHKSFTITALGCKDSSVVNILSDNSRYSQSDDAELFGVNSNKTDRFHSPYNYILLSFMSKNDNDKNAYK